MGIHHQESGTLALLRKPGKMPAGTIPSRRESSSFWTANMDGGFTPSGDAQVQRIAASQLEDLRSPLRFLLGHTQLQKELNGLTLSTTAAGLQLSGVPKGTQEKVAEITLLVTAGGVIRSMSITETDGARTSFTFSDDQPNAPVSDADFVFHAPAGIPLVNAMLHRRCKSKQRAHSCRKRLCRQAFDSLRETS